MKVYLKLKYRYLQICISRMMASKIRCITLRLEELRDKVTKAVESVAVFATEWGTCDASGDGTLNFEETKTWLLGLL